MKPIYILLFFCFSLMGSCTKEFVGTGISNGPEQNFEVLWQDFSRHYGAFGPKNINWEDVYRQYRPLIKRDITERELYNVLTRMLDTLNDNHIYLRPLEQTGLPWYSGGILGRTKVEGYSTQVAQAQLKEKWVYNNALEYGVFANNIGYINIISFGNNINTYYKAMDVILNKLKDTRGIVVELRSNGGGEDRVAQYIANRFATETNHSFSARLRNGAGYQDFGEPIVFYTQPEGSYQYTKPVILLTNLNVFSSGETFVLAMLQNKNVRHIGTITGGALSDAVTRDLPNGWSYRMPIADVRDAQGRNLEGIGIQPAVVVQQTKEDLQQGRDKIVEKALELLQ